MGGDVSRIRGDESALKNLKLRNLTNLSPGYILKMKQRFESASEEYQLDAKALKEFFKCRDSEIEELLRLFDVEKTGSIDSYEFVCALGMMAKGSLNEKAQLIFSFYDFDNSLSISKDEFTVLMTNCLTALKYLEGKKAPTVSEIEQKTNEFFAEADEDNDATVQLKQFISYVNKDKEILTVLKSYGIASSEDLGRDFGRAKSEVPDIDSDLEEECNPSDLKKSYLKNYIKDGEIPDEEAEKEVFTRRKQLTQNGIEKNTFPQEPDNYQRSKIDSTAPDASLELEYAYGFRSRDVRNNLRYTADGDLVYHTAGVAIIMDKKKNTQRHFLGHRDDIHCLAIDESGELVATGEIGAKPRLCIWNTRTLQELFQIVSPMTKGIKNVAFSKDGRKLVCSDMDLDHFIYVFDLTQKLKAGETLRPVAQGSGGKQPILSIGFNHTGEQIIATGVRTVSFFKINGSNLELKNGSGWGKTPADSVICQTLSGQTIFTGTFLGEIISWTDSIIQARISGHKGKVNCIQTNREGTTLITGGSDGNLIMWQIKGASLELIKKFNLKLIGLQSMKAYPTSACFSNDGESILIGTRGGEICEINISNSKPTVHMRSHFDGELWGLAVHPSKPLFYTFGQDSVLAVWDLKTRRQLKHCKLESDGDVLNISHSGQILVIGFNNGTLIALDQDADFTPIARRKDRNGSKITCIQFTPNDKICAVGGQDQIIMTYDVLAQFKPLKKLKGSSQTIWHMDFSLDSQMLQSHDNWFDMESGKNDKQSYQKWKNETWNTWTRTDGWQVSGIYPIGASGEDINAVDRSTDGKVLATADDFGLVKLFRFPAIGTNHIKYQGHSSQVTNIKFSNGSTNQQYLISIGGQDKSILQWKYNFDKEAALESLKQSQKIQESEFDSKVLENLQEKDDFAEESLGDGDQAMVGIRENDGALKALTPPGFKFSKNAYDPPTVGVTLTWAHGFRSWDVRGNLKYDQLGNVIYTTAGLGIVHDTKARKQEFFNVHGNDIVAMAIHPERDIVATGQMANDDIDDQKPGLPSKLVEQGAFKGKSQTVAGKLVPILIWRASTREVICRIYGFHRGQITGLRFSPSGNKLLSSSDLGGTAIYNWANGTKLADGGIGGQNMNWKNEDEYAVASQNELITYIHNGSVIKGKKCLIGDHKPCSVNFVFKNAVMITGGVTGEIITWNGLNGTNPGKTYKSSHTSGIWAIEKAVGKTAETVFYTGGNEGKIVVWNFQFQPTQTIDIACLSTFTIKAGIRSLDVKQDGSLLVGTSGAEVLEVDKQGKLIQVIVQGHFRGVTAKLEHPEVWGLTVHPTQQIFASAGADKTVRIWNAKKMIKCSAQLAHDPTALDWSPNGKFIAVGDRWGYISILDSNSLDLLSTQQTTLTSKATKGTENGVWVQAIHWSPDGTKVALGTHGGRSKLEIAQIDERGIIKNIKANDMGLASAITELDWSQDSKFVIVNSSDVFNLDTGKRDPHTSSYNQTQWQTWTGRGFIANGTGEAKCRDRSHNGLFMATGDRFSNLNIYRCPTVDGAQKKSFIGHSSFVTNVKFTANDDYIITTGGNDLSVFVWNTDIYDEEDQKNDEEEQENLQDHPDIPETLVKIDFAKENKLKLKQEQQLLKPVQKELNEFEEEELGEGDQFLAVIPWKNQVKAPTGFKHPNKQNLPPNIRLEIDWIHGYCGDQNCLSYLEDDSVAYPAAAIGVCYKSEGHLQRYFSGHEGRITCIAFAPDKRTVATGDATTKSTVIIWDGITMKQSVKITSKNLKKGVCQVAFSPSGKYLAITDNSEDANIIVVDTKTGAEVAVSRKCVGNIAFEDDQTFVSVGKGIKGSQFTQWKINASSISSKQGAFGENSKLIHGVVFNGNTALTGNVNGDVYLWNGTQIKEVKKFGHTRLIEAITVTQDVIFFGGKDSKITVTDKSYNLLIQLSLENLKDSVNSQIRAITLNKRSDRIMVATFGHELVEIPIDLKIKKFDISTARIQVHGHYAPMSTWTNEVWGLTTFKDKDRMITSSDDGTLKIWDAVTHRQIASIQLDVDGQGNKIPPNPQTKEIPYSARGRAVDVSSKGDYFAVGMFDGTLRCYDARTFELQAIKRCVKGKNADKEWIQDLKFSPDGLKLAVTTHEGKIWIFDVKNQFSQIGKEFGKTTSFITQMDWSLDGELIRTVDASYELLYYTVSDGKQQTAGASAYKDTQWATHNVIYSFQAQGIWQAGQDGTDINYADVSNRPVIDNMQLIASGNDNDKVHVFRYPSVDEKSKPVIGHGHASDVTKVKFNFKDSLLISTGGNDTTVIQWKIIPGDQK